MAGALGRNLHLCFTKIKPPLDAESPSYLLASHDRSRPLAIKNFNSLCDCNLESTSKSPPHLLSSSSSSSSSAAASFSSVPDFATVFASQRFFFSSPGRSNSIIESPDSPVMSQKCNAVPLLDSNAMKQSSSDTSSSGSWNSQTFKDSVAVPTYSPDPYLDFRRSMQEMVEARGFVDVEDNWDYLHELLLCYLALNPRSTHKFIVRAFADLLVSDLLKPPPPPAVGE